MLFKKRIRWALSRAWPRRPPSRCRFPRDLNWTTWNQNLNHWLVWPVGWPLPWCFPCRLPWRYQQLSPCFELVFSVKNPAHFLLRLSHSGCDGSSGNDKVTSRYQPLVKAFQELRGILTTMERLQRTHCVVSSYLGLPSCFDPDLSRRRFPQYFAFVQHLPANIPSPHEGLNSVRSIRTSSRHVRHEGKLPQRMMFNTEFTAQAEVHI